MKKQLFFLFSLSLFLLGACGDDSGNKPTNDNAVTPDNAVTDDVVNDEVVTDETVTDNAVTDETVTDETVTDNTVTDETGDDLLNDGEQPDEDATIDPLVTHLVGVWAQKLELFADATVPVVGDIVTRTDKILRIPLEEQNGKVVMDMGKVQVCFMQTFVTEGSAIAKGIVTNFPPKFTSNFFYVPPTALKEPLDQISIAGTPDNFSFKMNRWYELRGCYFQGENGTAPFDIETEMITEKNDPRIFDHDEDTRPGHTFEIKSTIANGLIWGAIKNYMELTSTSGAGDRIEGVAQWNEVEVVIGTDNPLFDGPRTVTAHKDGNTMVMVRVDASDDCAAINAKKDTLFKK